MDGGRRGVATERENADEVQIAQKDWLAVSNDSLVRVGRIAASGSKNQLSSAGVHGREDSGFLAAPTSSQVCEVDRYAGTG